MPVREPRPRFHEGEREVQRRAGVERTAAKVARYIDTTLSPEQADFLSRQPFLVLAGKGADRRTWASLMAGGSGTARALDERRLLLLAQPAACDPLARVFEHRARIGLLALESDTRTRIRLNGVAERTGDGVVVTVEEAFRNCPKFIQRRVPDGALQPSHRGRHRSGSALERDETRLIGEADTFFTASSHPERGLDASHRGGRPGFVEVPSGGTRLRFPDHSGNRMFQTLGNLAVDPSMGLLFVDWETGTTLQVSGRAHVVWDEKETQARPGAERLVDVAIESVHRHEQAMAARWRLVDRSPLNPPLQTA